VIQPFGLRDALTIKRLQSSNVAFDLKRLLLYSPSPLRSALAGYLTNHHLGTITCVHRDDKKHFCGYVQVWPRADRPEWELGCIAPSLDEHEQAGDIWRQMLSHIIIKGAELGNLRSYARSSEDAEAEDVFRQAGFTVISREEVFVCSREPSPAPLPKGLRPVTRRDHWALNEFYRQVVPHLVQQAEGFSPHWCTAGNGSLLHAVSSSGYVWADKGKIIAYMGLCRSTRAHWLEIVVRPEYRADLLPYLKYMLMVAKSAERLPVYCPVADYSVGLGWLLRTCGFESYTRQVMLAAYTMARVPIRQRVPVHSGLQSSVDIGTPAIYQKPG